MFVLLKIAFQSTLWGQICNFVLVPGKTLKSIRRPFFTFSSPGPNSTSRHYQNFSKRVTFSNNHLREAGGNVTLVNREEQECAACITLLINRLIRAIVLKRVFDDLLSHSPPPVQSLSLGVTGISRKGRLFPTILGTKFFCELWQHFCPRITTPPLSSRYMMIKTDHNIKGIFLIGYERDSSKYEAEYHAKILPSTARLMTILEVKHTTLALLRPAAGGVQI